MKRALLAATAFFIALFALGFVLGTIRVLFVAPRFGSLAAILAEVPVMLFAAVYACRWAVRRWQVADALAIRGAMVVWFVTLLAVLETTLGKLLLIPPRLLPRSGRHCSLHCEAEFVRALADLQPAGLAGNVRRGSERSTRNLRS